MKIKYIGKKPIYYIDNEQMLELEEGMIFDMKEEVFNKLNNINFIKEEI